MQAGATFEEVLTSMLGEEPPARAIAPPPAPPVSFVFLKPGVRDAVAALERTMATVQGARAAFAPKPMTAPRPVRQLTSSQERSLHELVSLGADLDPDFTRAELRSAFRLLARHYHPDRHASSTRVDQARLSRIFATVCEHYRTLAAAL